MIRLYHENAFISIDFRDSTLASFNASSIIQLPIDDSSFDPTATVCFVDLFDGRFCRNDAARKSTEAMKKHLMDCLQNMVSSDDSVRWYDKGMTWARLNKERSRKIFQKTIDQLKKLEK